MRAVVMLLWIASVAVAVPASARSQDDRPRRSVKDSDLQNSINATIDKALDYLGKAQGSDGRWAFDVRTGVTVAGGRQRAPLGDDYSAGLTALALYSLAASGVPASDERVKRALAWCAANERPFADGKRATYCASLLVLALTRIDPIEHKKWIHRLAQRLADAQLDNGMWNYELAGRRNRRTMGRFSGGDNSNSQFAVLALWSAQTWAKFRVPAKVWREVRDLYDRTQQDDGGWSYKEPSRTSKKGRPAGFRMPLWMYKSKATMTAAGLVSRTCAASALRGGVKALPKARKGKVVERGLGAFLADRANWEEMFWDYYYVYSVERVGTLLGLPDDEWYPTGARILTSRQLADGRWPRRAYQPGRGRVPAGGHGDPKQVYETSLALLFLTKATAYPITPGK